MKFSPSNKHTFLLGATASFGTYFCMYAFRKPFSVATYNNVLLWNIDFKILLIISQVIGYMLAKFVGVKFIAELRAKNRATYLLVMIFMALFSLWLLPLSSIYFAPFALFLNGLSLGMIWGVVFSYIEGRRVTELIGVILCSSFIVSSGIVKSVGLWVMQQFSVSEYWMPLVTASIFLIPFLFFVWLLEKIPAPTENDIQEKSIRVQMNKSQRRAFIKQFLFPISILVFFYTVLTVLRDIRDNFAPEIWSAFQLSDSVSIYTLSEIPIAVLVLVFIGFIGFVRHNKRAFLLYHLLVLTGAFSIGLFTYLFEFNSIGPVHWMIGLGLGTYMCYVPFNSLFFDRCIAAFNLKANAGFLIYIADAFGYIGSVAVLLYKNFGNPQLSWVSFFVNMAYIGCIVGMVSITLSGVFFWRLHNKSMNRSLTLRISKT